MLQNRTRPAQFLLCASLLVSGLAVMCPFIFPGQFSTILGYLLYSIPLGILAAMLSFFARSVGGMIVASFAAFAPMLLVWLLFSIYVSPFGRLF